MGRSRISGLWTSAVVVWVAAVLIAVVMVTAYVLYQRQVGEVRERRLDELAALGASQVAATDDWLAERRGDVSVVAGSPSVVDFLERGPGDRSQDGPRGAAAILDLVASTFDYDAVMLVDTAGILRMVRPSLNAELAVGEPVPSDVLTALAEAARTHAVQVVVAATAEESGGKEHVEHDHSLRFCAPVRDADGVFVGGVVYSVVLDHTELPAVLARKRLGSDVNAAVESFVLHEEDGVGMVVAAEPAGSARADGRGPAGPPEGVLASTLGGVSMHAVEGDGSGETWLTSGVWSPKLAMAFVNREPAGLVAALFLRTTLLGVLVAILLIVATAALALANIRGSRLKAAVALRELEAGKADVERRLAQSERMELMGRMAGGVAHDFNNLLAVVIGHLELADGSAGSIWNNEDLRAAHDAAVRAARIGRQLVGVGRRQVLERAPLDLKPDLARTVAALRGLAPAGVTVELAAQRSLSRVHADPVEIERVVLNLAMNAIEAVGDAGTVVLGAEDRVVEHGTVTVNGMMPPGRYAVLTVRDDGPGIPKDQQARVFEPFFTTKGEDRNSGLGLASAVGVVSQHGGFLTVSSEPGLGALFEVYLPALGDAPSRDSRDGQGAAAASAAPDSPDFLNVPGPPDPLGAPGLPSGDAAAVAKAAAGGAVVLVVDDEAGVLAFVARYLRSRGYQVLTAASAGAAEEAWASAGRIDLLVSDVIMPGGTGLELLASLRSRQPALPAVLMSGYAAGAALGHDERPAGCAFLAKPFSLAALDLEVTRALDDGFGPGRRGAGPGVE